jgi:uncharacterized protein
MPDERASIAVHVTPRSGRDEVYGLRGDELAVRVTAAPDEGKANEAVCRTVARFLGVPRTAVTVTRGTTSRHKQVRVAGVDRSEIDRIVSERFPGQG